MTGTEHLVHTLRSQGRVCTSSGSPMYRELLELVAADVESGGVFASILADQKGAPEGQAVPLRLLGGLHRMVLDGRAPANMPVGSSVVRAPRHWILTSYWSLQKYGTTTPVGTSVPSIAGTTTRAWSATLLQCSTRVLGVPSDLARRRRHRAPTHSAR